MNTPRPRLLVASLVGAVAVIGLFVWLRSDPANDDDLDVVLGGGVVTYPDGGLENATVEGDPFPYVTFLDREDGEVTSSDLLGEPLVVNLWFSTCTPCAKELPAFAEVDAETDVRFIGVNTIDDVETMERFAGERGVEYELLRDHFAELADGIGAVAFPVTLFVTSDGTIIEQTGALDADELRAEVANLEAVEAAA